MPWRALLLAGVTMRFTYEITPRPASLGGGCRLRLQVDGQEVGGGIFVKPAGNPDDIAAWWAGLDDVHRIEWLDRSGGVSPADAYDIYAQDKAYADAEAAAQAWLDVQRAS